MLAAETEATRKPEKLYSNERALHLQTTRKADDKKKSPAEAEAT